jgi:hypothetical protein
VHDKFVALQQQKNLRIREIPSLSETRWACRWRSLDTILQRLDIIVDLLSSDSFTASEAVEAKGLLHQILSVSFLSSLLIFHELLSLTHCLSESLQSPQLHAGNAASLVEAVKSALEKKRANSEKEFEALWNEVKCLCEKFDVDMCAVGGRRKRKINERANFLIVSPIGQGQSSDFSGNPSDNLRISIFIPILERFMAELTRRFTPEAINMTKAVQALVSVDYVNFFEFEDMKPLLDVVGEPLGVNPTLLKSELVVAKEMIAASTPVVALQDVLLLLSDDASFRNLRQCIRAALRYLFQAHHVNDPSRV